MQRISQKVAIVLHGRAGRALAGCTAKCGRQKNLVLCSYTAALCHSLSCVVSVKKACDVML